MQSGYHNLPVINGVDQKEGKDFKAKNSTFSANEKTITFSTDIAGAYPENARVKSWIRSYTLNRGKNFVVRDKYELAEDKKEVKSSNFITCCKVTETKPGLLHFQGEGFSMNMSYNPRVVTARIEFKEVTDRSLKRYWPGGVTRVVLEFNHPGLKGGQEVVFTPAATL